MGLNLLLDPRLFNYIILALFAMAALRWAFAGNIPQAGYWASAFALNVFVTMGIK